MSIFACVPWEQSVILPNMDNTLNRPRHLTPVARRLQLRRACSDELLRLLRGKATRPVVIPAAAVR